MDPLTAQTEPEPPPQVTERQTTLYQEVLSATHDSHPDPHVAQAEESTTEITAQDLMSQKSLVKIAQESGLSSLDEYNELLSRLLELHNSGVSITSATLETQSREMIENRAAAVAGRR